MISSPHNHAHTNNLHIWAGFSLEPTPKVFNGLAWLGLAFSNLLIQVSGFFTLVKKAKIRLAMYHIIQSGGHKKPFYHFITNYFRKLIHESAINQYQSKGIGVRVA
jgi:hypothetical protein